METREVTLGSFGDGVAEELFKAAMEQVLTNIDDPNTDPKAARSVTLRFDFKTEDDRRTSKIAVSCGTKLAGVRPASATVFIGRHDGRLSAREAPKQEDMFPQPVGRPVAVEMGGA